MQKTNAMRILDSASIEYTTHTYEVEDGNIDGISVANKLKKDVNIVFKTLVAQGNSKEVYVFVIPVSEELNLKKAAKVANEKRVELVHVKDINKLTGYIRGGCSPIGMKKNYRTFIHKSAEALDRFILSGGKIGVQIEVNPKEIISLIKGSYEDLIM